MFNGRSPASRTPSSRPYIAVLVLIAVFYSKQMYADLKWTLLVERIKSLEAEEKKRNPDYKIPTVKPTSR